MISRSLLSAVPLLTSAIVRVKNSNDEFIYCRTLLDTCSTANLITEDLAVRLNVPINKCAFQIGTLNSTSTTAKGMVEITIQSRHNQFYKTLNFLIIPEIVNRTPTEDFPRNKIKIPKNLNLADPEFHLPRSVDMLIGSGPTISMLSIGQINLSQNNYQIHLQKTLLGWIVAGCANTRQSKASISCNFVELKEQIEKFWRIEEVSIEKPRSKEDIECEKHFITNVSRNADGRYVVRLPFRNSEKGLGNSRAVAYKRFYALEKKLESDPKLRMEYEKVMQEYIDLGHMSLVEQPTDDGYYMPHHAVIKLSSATTKVRTVFDGSAPSDSGVSLNDLLMIGPTIQAKIFEHLIKFRFHKYVLTADIEKMYRQIWVHEDDRKFQRILWRMNGRICTFQLNTVTFGVSCSPYLAIRTLHKLADDEAQNFPLASEAIKNDLYVDDELTGKDKLTEALKLRDETIALLARGHFNIRQWASNDERLLVGIADKNLNQKFLLDKDCTLRTLGISWDARNDQLRYSVDPIIIPPRITKRNILSEIAKIFDPLGLLTPVILHAKKIMQDVWQAKVDWDESLPESIHVAWKNFVNELDLLNEISFERRVLEGNPGNIQVHGFCDASTVGYGACLYLRTVNTDNEVSCHILCAKSKVAPLKPTTIPRLELCGAQLLVHLYEESIKVFKYTPSEITFWTDSTIVLHWLKMSPQSLKTYAANRVTEIQEKTKDFNWRHIRSEDNPADASSRGQLPSAFLQNSLWKNGPIWLKQPENMWPVSIVTVKEIPELRGNTCLLVDTSTPDNLDQMMYIKRFSSYSKLLRVTACILRLMPSNRINGIRRDSLSTEEIVEAEIRILKFIQSIHFKIEIDQIKTNGSTQKSKLANLCPILDEHGLLRVGGRLKNSSLAYTQKHPIFLPSRNYLTDLIIRETHLKHHHSGIQSTLYALRHRFWILDGKNQVRKITRECIRCFRFRAEAIEYKMGNLPEVRVTEATVFDNVGIDYCGPFYIKEKKRYNKVKIKVYVCVFICMTIKAVHFEIVCDLSTEGFLGALRRFIARRGTPSNIYSDNGTNFVGGNNQLRELYALFNSDEHKSSVHKFGSDRRIKWHFIPPLSPHQGGLWESMVKLFKHHFKRVVGDSVFTLDELGTFTSEIEGILNSRPLTPLSSDPNDLSALTPALYLLGKPSTNLPERDLLSTPTNRLSVWEHISKIRQDFWKRWNSEYLNELQRRGKWFKNGKNLQINDMVLIKDKNLPCTQWQLGRIIEVHPGDENVVRTVTLRTAKGILKRSVKLLCPLPIEKIL